MDLQRKLFTTKLNGEDIKIEVSKLAGQTNAAVIGYHGNTSVLATVVMGKEDKQGDFFPLTVDYEERFYAAGKIIGSRFVRREGKASEEAILSGRLIDRTIRPLFDQRLRREVQVVVTVLAYDEKNDPDIISLIAASTALGISDIPWNGPVAGVQVIKNKENGEQRYKAFFAGPEMYVNMIEFQGSEENEDEVVKIFADAHEEIKKLIDFQKKIIKEVGKPKLNILFNEPNKKVYEFVHNFIKDKIDSALKEKKIVELLTELNKEISASVDFQPEELKEVLPIFETYIDEYVHKNILEKEERPDGRKLNEIRELYGEIGLLELTHGSGLFIRGTTQVLAVTTLASLAAEQLIETMETTGRKRFMLHYNFPNFSVGEIGKSKGPGRREIGHGTLAFKAVNAMIPTKEEFPYTIRVVAETLSSNGSSSMASTCAASLSLMDAGVPVKKHVAGIAMGLMSDEKTNKYKILTDIQGPEDHYGDMDLKVAGTDSGVNAIQMDVKINGINAKIFKEALSQAKDARLQILKVMNAVISEPRKNVSVYAPKIISTTIPVDKIGEVIGPGGRNINGIIASCENQINIDIEETGKVYVAGVKEDLVKRAIEYINLITHEYKVGEIITGKIIKILDFGAIVDLGGGRDGMIHVSELKEGFVKKVEDVVKLGDIVTAKIIKAEPDGKIGLSLKNLLK